MNEANIAAIARELGVSTTTVHRALHHGAGVSERTRQQVLETAARLGYRPNRVAQGLRSRRTFSLGVVLTGISSSYYARILEGIEQAGAEQGYSILLASSQDDPAKEREHIELLLEKRVDGFIIAPADPSANRAYYEQLIAEEAHVVFVGRHVPGVPISSVETDNVLGGYLAGRHLQQLGRRRVAVVTTIAPKRQYTYVSERMQGCARALAEAGAPSPVIIGEDNTEAMPLPEFAYLTTSQYVQKGGMMDGVFALNDDLAYGVISALVDLGLRVPEDVAVVGFNDESMSAFFRPSVTTVRSPLRQLGAEAVRLLIDQVLSASRAEPVRRILLEPALVIRHSCSGSVREHP